MSPQTLWRYLVPAALVVLSARFYAGKDARVAAATVRFSGPINSQPLALSADDSLLLVANPDNNSVTLFDVRPNHNVKLAEIPVGTEPNGVALSPDGSRGYVANTVSGTVTVLNINTANYSYGGVQGTIQVGTEPYALALTPQGTKLYVANARSNSVSVIDTAKLQVIKTITDVGPEPRGIAITNSGTSSDADETVFVTQFLSLPIAGKIDGADDAKAGHVTVISAASDSVTGDITLNPVADTGFKAAGDALQRIAAPATPAPEDFKFTTGAYPNQLNNIAIRGKFAYVPNTGASPNGPTRFDVNTQSLLHVLDLNAKTDASKTINMHKAVGLQTNTTKRFITQPWAIAFKHKADEAYVISAASNIVVKLKTDPATGAPAVQSDPTDTTRVLEIPTGKNPRGIVVNSTDTTAYVMNYVSRDVSVIDLSGQVEKATTTLASASLPQPGTPEDKAQIGKELYFTSIGEFDAPAQGQPAITGRMSNNGWGSCSTCHPFGLSDNVVWIFATGPRRTVPQHADFERGNTANQRALNWSAIFDEEEDFESNIRGISGGKGLIVLSDGTTQDPALGNFTPASGGRNQLKVRGIGAWDAIKAFVQTGIRAPISPVSKTDPDVVAGRQLFIDANCQSCHGGAQWTSSRVRFTAPPDPSMIVNGQIITELRNVGTFNASDFNEVRATAAAPLGANGFNPPTLLSLFAFPQTFFHNGSANSLDAVLQNTAHRTAGTFGIEKVATAQQRAQLAKFLLSIDAATQPIQPQAPGALNLVNAASYTTNAFAPESAMGAFGSLLATQQLSATTNPLPGVLANTTVAIQDASGAMRLAPLYFVAGNQVNFLLPPGTATGTAKVTITSNSGAVSVANLAVANTAPGIFAAEATGKGVAAATAIRVSTDGTQTPVDIFSCQSSGKCATVPIDLGSGQVFVTFYGTGLRNRTSLANVRATIGGVDVPVSFAGAQGAFAGLDQLNVQIPSSLKGKGEVPVVFTIDGQTTNAVNINLK